MYSPGTECFQLFFRGQVRYDGGVTINFFRRWPTLFPSQCMVGGRILQTPIGSSPKRIPLKNPNACLYLNDLKILRYIYK